MLLLPLTGWLAGRQGSPRPSLPGRWEQVPQAAEQGEVERLHRAANRIQSAWRRYRRRQAWKRRMAASHSAEADGPPGTATRGRGPQRLESMLGSPSATPHQDTASDWQGAAASRSHTAC